LSTLATLPIRIVSGFGDPCSLATLRDGQRHVHKCIDATQPMLCAKPVEGQSGDRVQRRFAGQQWRLCFGFKWVADGSAALVT
jgi:hypothetical protein